MTEVKAVVAATVVAAAAAAAAAAVIAIAIAAAAAAAAEAAAIAAVAALAERMATGAVVAVVIVMSVLVAAKLAAEKLLMNCQNRMLVVCQVAATELLLSGLRKRMPCSEDWSANSSTSGSSYVTNWPQLSLARCLKMPSFAESAGYINLIPQWLCQFQNGQRRSSKR